jgi:predicted phage gp36 major capsid-like protein
VSQDWAEQARAIIAQCVGDRAAAGHTAWRQTLASALREAYERGATDERARIFHTDTFGSGSSSPMEPTK